MQEHKEKITSTDEHLYKPKLSKRNEPKKETENKKALVKPKRSRPLKHVVGSQEVLPTLHVVKGLSVIRFVAGEKIISGGTKEHADILKKYCLMGLNQILRAIKKDEVSIVLILRYKHMNSETTESVDVLSDVLKTCSITKSFKLYYDIVSQSTIRSLFQINFNPRVIGIKKTYLDNSSLKDLLSQCECN
ncbi:hypothetical protein EDI_339600 [Entamoeba dispar SAW760]|uniref:Uncharacterized protein n=1 Tax=Entamoeba dispar (strain ATCC PRA-260 / SAW760) TaxID=370354 RepID=B0EDV6_ENTDS|nr:uncharacterized protein EDI_339600 [Entamoeba dispar SAW760]EDR27295.1 hypothetical protein EDI_339600 [Entamoeba dispar SAW760]|eukprot:EDR27295.1 hypothetical protein EDI_339600 [Entamoeba dispar SAW760]